MPIVKLIWDGNGLNDAIKHNNIIIIVDVLRFSSTAITAVNNGTTIIPSYTLSHAKTLSKKNGAMVSALSKYSLSPASFLKVPRNSEIILVSTNGARYSRLSSNAQLVLVGALLNAGAVAKHAYAISKQFGRDIAIVAAGEKKLVKKMGRNAFEESFADDKNKDWFCLEDFLGAGAIISGIAMEKTDEALYAQATFQKYKNKLLSIIRSAVSGRYLIDLKKENDIEFCSQLNKYTIVPQMVQGKIKKLMI